MIPKQLKDCKFCKVIHKTKKPYEKGWTKKPYSYLEMKEHLSRTKANYGILTGINYLGVLDDDTEDKRLIKLYEENFPKTYRTRDHYYFFLDEWDGKKIILYDPEEKDKEGKPLHLGEIQGAGQMVVGAHSIHPSGEEYDLRNDVEIVEINFNKVKEVFKKYMNKTPAMIKKDYTPKKTDSSDFLDRLNSHISMEQILSHFGVDTQSNPTNCIFHSSKGNKCLGFNSETAHCFHCDGSWNVFSFVKQVKNINSAEAIEWLADFAGMGDEFKKNKEEYGKRNKEPMGWALSINIKEMAERRGYNNCPTCSVPFNFDERLGWFNCPTCTRRGGIKKLIKLFEK